MKRSVRNAKAYNVRYSSDEQLLIAAKALCAGTTPTEWIRAASLERRPPARKSVPEINREAWLALADLTTTINSKIWDYSEDGELHKSISALRAEITTLRLELMGQSGGADTK